MNCSRAIVTIVAAILLILTGLTGCEPPVPTPAPADELPSTSEPDSLQPDTPSPQVETPVNSEAPSTSTPETTEDDGIFIEGTLADEQLQKDVLAMIMIFEKVLAPKCNTQKVTGKGITRAMTADGKWAERWTLDRCGESVAYDITFWPDNAGGIYFGVSLVKTP